ncbi:MAG: NAD(P)H-binding protein [Thermoplasmatales archaeon]|nr:NAD(P)H-binding protein [Thermoplasmatales archaeon]MCW6169740.1 NAD(P)H-binding protein [Thermoplasmatales archaeon]
MKVVIIGGSGYIGRNIAKYIQADSVTSYSRSENAELKSAGIQWIEGSITEADKLNSALNGADMIIVSVRTEKEDGSNLFDTFVNGIKNVVGIIKKNDTDQRLVFISSINVHYGASEFFRIRGLVEDNVSLVKNHLNVRPSIVFGNGDVFTENLFRLASTGISRLPIGGPLAPIHVKDLVTVIQSAKDTKGAIDANSNDKITFADAANLAFEKLGKRKRSIAEGKFWLKRSIASIENTNIFEKEEVHRLLLNYYREDTYLYRFVKNPISFSDYIKNYEIKA